MPYEFRRFRIKVVAHFGFETVPIYKKDFRSIDQVVKCLAGFDQNCCSWSIEDRYLDRFMELDEVINQFRED